MAESMCNHNDNCFWHLIVTNMVAFVCHSHIRQSPCITAEFAVWWGVSEWNDKCKSIERKALNCHINIPSSQISNHSGGTGKHGESANKPNQQSRTLIKQNTHLIFSILAHDHKLKIEQNDILLKQWTDSEPTNQFCTGWQKWLGQP